jgi:predicted PhzF superfamily epimerase YddE/YHI9
MKLPIYQVDAFTSRLFGGNPAAVVLLDDWLSDSVLQNVALENNLSETAFVIPHGETSQLRWFTPTMEVDLCGHATLAAGHVLFNHRFPDANQIQFDTRSGILGVRRSGEWLSLDFPSLPPAAAVVPGVKAALGVEPRETLMSNSLLAVFDTEDDIRAIRPDFDRVKALGAWMVIVTAPSTAGTDTDYVFRVFAPGAGIPEDPATGSAQCTLIPYWAARLGKTTFIARQLSARVGEFTCELRGKRVSISGKAMEYLQGEIHVG